MFRLKIPLIPSLVPRSTAEREDVYNVDDRSKSLQQQSGDVAAWRKTTRNLNKLTSAHPRRRHGSTPASDPPNATPAHAAPAPLHPAPPAHRRSRFPT
ncbi:hypothetical protein AGABI1DRAFT_115229, partial [Agaricus bisporus var. burnettii JB137-S8]